MNDMDLLATDDAQVPQACLAARLKAAREYVNKEHWLLSKMVHCMILADLLTNFVVVLTGWMFHAAWMLPAFFVRLAVAITHNGFNPVMRDPVRMLFPYQYSYFGLQKPQSNGKRHHIMTLGLLLGYIMLQNSLYAYIPKHVNTALNHTAVANDSESQKKCEEIPRYMPCEHVDIDEYKSCTEETPLWAEGTCNINVANQTMMRKANEGDIVAWCSMMFIYGSLAVAYVAWPFLSLLLSACGCQCMWCVPSKDQAVFEEINKNAIEIEKKLEEKPDEWDTLLIIKDIGLYVADVVVLDLLGAYNFFRTWNLWFGGIALLCYLKSFYDLASSAGGVTEIVNAFSESLRKGYRTDAFLKIVHGEFASEAPVAFALQIYGFMFVTFDTFASASFLCSMLCSMYSLISGAYRDYQLGIDTSPFKTDVDKADHN